MEKRNRPLNFSSRLRDKRGELDWRGHAALQQPNHRRGKLHIDFAADNEVLTNGENASNAQFLPTLHMR